jgi:hypothetical protein
MGSVSAARMDSSTVYARAVIGAGSILTAALMGGILGYIDDGASITTSLQVGLLAGVAVAALVFAGLFNVEGVDEDAAN